MQNRRRRGTQGLVGSLFSSRTRYPLLRPSRVRRGGANSASTRQQRLSPSIIARPAVGSFCPACLRSATTALQPSCKREHLDTPKNGQLECLGHADLSRLLSANTAAIGLRESRQPLGSRHPRGYRFSSNLPAEDLLDPMTHSNARSAMGAIKKRTNQATIQARNPE